MKHIYIKNVKIAQTAALAPMADVADTAFRVIAKKFGAAYTVGEMTSAKGLVFGDRKTAELLKITDKERPAAVQLFGSEPETMAEAVAIALEYNPDIIDINAGCPVNKVVKTGAGSALMKTPDLLGKIVNKSVKSVEKSDKTTPVTVKIRAGWDENNINAVEVAKIAEANGAAAITVHGRTRVQMYSGKSDSGIIAAVKNAVKIPVIGNGDVCSASGCIDMYRQTGCDLVMIGRAALGRPWIFKEIECFLKDDGGNYELPDLNRRLSVMREHIELAAAFKGERIALRESRKQAAWYIKGIRGAAALRAECMKLETLEDLYRLIEMIKTGV